MKWGGWLDVREFAVTSFAWHQTMVWCRPSCYTAKSCLWQRKKYLDIGIFFKINAESSVCCVWGSQLKSYPHFFWLVGVGRILSKTSDSFCTLESNFWVFLVLFSDERPWKFERQRISKGLIFELLPKNEVQIIMKLLTFLDSLSSRITKFQEKWR